MLSNLFLPCLFLCPTIYSEIIAVGDKRKRGRPCHVAGALSGPKTYSLANSPMSVVREQILIDSDVGVIVGYTNKQWTVLFPLLKDDNGDKETRSYSLANILRGIEDYKNIFPTRSEK